MNSFWHLRPTLVTGGTGFVGGCLIERLLESGAEVVSFSRTGPRPIEPALHPWNTRAHRALGDVRDRGALVQILADHEIETVFHLAAQTAQAAGGVSPVSAFETNIAGTWNVLEACRRSTSVRQVVLLSSERTYSATSESTRDDLWYDENAPLAGRYPVDASKSCADLIARSYAQTFELPVAISRCGNLFGGGDLNWQRIVPGTIRAALAGRRPIVRSDALVIRDYLHVEEAAAACMLLAERLAAGRELRGETFHFSYESTYSVLDLVNTILELMTVDLEPQVLKTIAHETGDRRLSAAKAHRLLGWRPLAGLEQALQQTIDWYQQFLEQGPWATRRHRADLVARPG